MTTRTMEPGLNPVHLQADRGAGLASIAGTVSWPAVFAGATVAASLTLVLFILGTGLGLSAISPWANQGIGVQTFGISSVLWVTLTSLAASAVGGYVAGRLRNGWQDINGDEVFFRDTAHGLLAWGISTLLMAALFTSVFTAIAAGAARTGAMAAGGAAALGTSAAVSANDQQANPLAEIMDYTVDSLFRSETINREEIEAAVPELSRILVNAVRTGTFPQEDEEYAASVIARSTGVTQQEAEQRIADAFVSLQNAEAAAREAADEARQASAYVSLWMVVSLLLGAFIASFAATYGGRQRDL